MLHDQKLLSDAEYKAALSDLKESIGDRGSEATTLLVGKNRDYLLRIRRARYGLRLHAELLRYRGSDAGRARGVLRR